MRGWARCESATTRSRIGDCGSGFGCFPYSSGGRKRRYKRVHGVENGEGRGVAGQERRS
jgi:hypothetical protein